MDRPGRYWSVMLLDAYTNVGYICRRLHGNGGCDRCGSPTTRRRRGGRRCRGRRGPRRHATVWVLARVLVAGPRTLAAARPRHGRHPGHQTERTVGAAAHRRWPEPGLDFCTGVPRRPAGSRCAARSARGLAPATACRARRTCSPTRRRTTWWQRDDAPARRGSRHGPGRRRRRERVGHPVAGRRLRRRRAYRAAFARFSLAGHLPAENRSYNRVVDGRQSAVLHFPAGGEPPVGVSGRCASTGPTCSSSTTRSTATASATGRPACGPTFDGSLTIEIGHHPPADPPTGCPRPTVRASWCSGRTRARPTLSRPAGSLPTCSRPSPPRRIGMRALRRAHRSALGCGRHRRAGLGVRR